MARITKKTQEAVQKGNAPKKKAIDKEKGRSQKPGFPQFTVDDYIGKNGIFIVVSLLVLMSLFVFRDFFFMKFIYLFKDIGSDSINVDYPASVLAVSLLEQQHYFTWTFHAGMGYPLNSGVVHPLHPLMAFNTILLPMVELIFGANPAFLKFPVFMIVFFLTGITAYLYFKTLESKDFICIIGSLLVAFMGYNIASSSWNHYYDVFYGIFLLFAFEQFYKKNRWYFIPMAIMMISYTFFNVYVYGLFLISYILFRYFTENTSFQKLVVLGLKVAGLSLWGLLMGIANFLPNLINAFNSPRVSNGIDAIKDISTMNPLLENRSYELSTAILRSFSPDMMGTGTDFRGWYNYLEAPLFYCGLISLVLVVQVFGFLQKREKLIFGTFSALWLFVALIPGLRNAFHLFLGNYYKVGINFFIPMILIFYGLKSLSMIMEQKRLNLPLLIISLLVLLLALFYPYKIGNLDLTDHTIRNYAALLLIFYSGLIFLLTREKYQIAAQIGIVLLVTIELSGFSYRSVSRRQNYTAAEFRISEGGYNDNSVPAIDYVKGTDTNFYRLEKDYSSGSAMHGSLNDAQAQGYYGTSLYSSYNQPWYISFLQETDIIEAGNETGTRWAPGLRNRPLLQTFASVKYHLSKSESPFLLKAGYSQLKEFGDVKLLKNDYYIPFGFCYSHYLTKADFDSCSSLQKDISLLRAFVIDEDSPVFDKRNGIFNRLLLSDTIASFDFDKYRLFTEQRKKDTLQILEFKQNYIRGTIALDSSGMFFASIPFDKGWKVKVNGENIEPVRINIGFIGFPLDAGKYTIEMKYFPDYLVISIILTLVSSLAFLVFLLLNKAIKTKLKLVLSLFIFMVLVISLFL